MKIYTRAGDYGETSIFGGARVRKSTPLIAAYGTLDELSSYIGLCRVHCEDNEELSGLLKEIQHDLYMIGSHIAGAEDCISESRISELEKIIDRYEEGLPELHTFILPSGTLLAAHLHVARAICRRAERKVTAIFENESAFHTELKYLNRLSDLLFILARHSNKVAGHKEERVIK
ncbi:MAG: cob(I)yrinic acid a,c-diamide adenosyltransferase [Candidatus Micrarchaeota archaeon]|nr:cob(I)yrinic acid a,c-diamide adenosyltransferase [Candidatus Micrarchaeota archaeon]